MRPVTSDGRNKGCLPLALGFILSITGFGMFGISYFEGYLPVYAFDRTIWRSEPHRRVSMIDSLLRSHRLDRLTRSEVEQLLGPATDTTYFSEWPMVYWLGDERGLVSIDSEWLVVGFDGEGRVSEHRIMRD